MAQRRREWFADKVCAKCGSTEKLELDHIDPSTKSVILRKDGMGRIWEWADIRRTEELAKCQALCHDCHNQKSAEERRTGKHSKVSFHGSRMYDMGCRCETCTAKHEATVLKRRASHASAGRGRSRRA